jgi:hypothetical protein
MSEMKYRTVDECVGRFTDRCDGPHVWPQPPMLDAATGWELSGFLHWLRIGLVRLVSEPSGPYETEETCLARALDAFESCHRFGEGKMRAYYESMANDRE